MFGISTDEKLISLYGCSVRSEKNAIKEEHAHVGEVYIFSKHLCFDLKVFAFHKQMVRALRHGEGGGVARGGCGKARRMRSPAYPG